MNEYKILAKAIVKAEINGFRYQQLISNSPYTVAQELIDSFTETVLLFNHDFAKAFWGEALVVVDEHYEAEIVSKDSKDAPFSLHGDHIQSWKLEFSKWQFHLREMVLEEEPLKYLEKFLEK